MEPTNTARPGDPASLLDGQLLELIPYCKCFMKTKSISRYFFSYFKQCNWEPFLNLKKIYLFAENKEKIFKKIHAPTSERQGAEDETEEAL